MIKVKMMLSLSVLEDYLKDVIHEIDGIKIRTIKTLEET
jgi:hypothetical protein